ncbi:hypothetical protein, partial [Alistipes senegalensis]|uniref:hypothetical protein n=1 Tax=Alistipes senegalensis TaxID=1288121 RepID=UPI00242BC18B
MSSETAAGKVRNIRFPFILLFSLGLFALWLRRRNGAFKMSGPFAGPSAIRVYARPVFFYRRDVSNTPARQCSNKF